MKNNQVYLDPQNVDGSMRQLERFYRLDSKTLQLLRRVVERYPRGVIVYVDEVNAQSMVLSPLDDLFTFNIETSELVLFSADTHTFLNGLIEMWMYVAGFETMMGHDDYWRVEFAIGAWKPIRDHIKQKLEIPVQHQVLIEVGHPPTTEEAPIEDPYPFKTLVSTFNIIAFTQMIRLAGRRDVKVHFPVGTNPKVIEAYYSMRGAMRAVGAGLGIDDVAEFNRRLKVRLEEIDAQYKPSKLPMPKGWEFMNEDRDAASGGEDEQNGPGGLLLGPSDNESSLGQLPPPNTWINRREKSQHEVDNNLAEGPFGKFINDLFEE